MSVRSLANRRIEFLIGGGILVLATLGAVAFVMLAGPRTDGPLFADSRFDVSLPLRSGQTATWGTVLPPNTGASAITIDAIEALNTEGLEVVGMVMSDPSTDGGIGTAEGFPPQGAHGEPVAGAVLKPAGGHPSYLQVLVGIRLSGTGDGSIEALRVRYRYSGVSYESVLPFGLKVVAASP
jgi:hypothetical protein